MATPLHFPPSHRAALAPYLPQHPTSTQTSAAPTPPLPFVTLTYAQSLDGKLAAAPGIRTTISGPSSKAMTHYIRSQHDAILVGSGTAIADDPALNCRLDDAESQPRPVILDRRGRWKVVEGSAVVRRAREGTGKGPWILVGRGEDGVAGGEGHAMDGEWERRRRVVEDVGGRVIEVELTVGFADVLEKLARLGIASVMVEGGATLIRELLVDDMARDLVDAVIVTVAPVYLGPGGQGVLVRQSSPALKSIRFTDVRWMTLGQDAIMMGRNIDVDS